MALMVFIGFWLAGPGPVRVDRAALGCNSSLFSMDVMLLCFPWMCWLKTSLSLPVLVTIVVTQHGVSRLGRLLLVQKAALQYVYTGRHLSATM